MERHQSVDEVGKVFTKTLQKRLQTVAEDVLLDTQCGFRSGRDALTCITAQDNLLRKLENTTCRSSCYFLT